jgi:hypothetical protein
MTKKSVTFSLEDEEHTQLAELAKKEDRYINAQARHMLRDCLKTVNDVQKLRYAAPEPCLNPARCDAEHNIVSPEAVDFMASVGRPPKKEKEPLPG